ncbi:DUF4176 domain-containing protein [Leifsonia sp. NPDC102414]|uniref:DUF4176 domain-containing protein n=1 Tax=Leifsonia sp. NPDC102414 TaxID=3364124 RepID=UPI0037F16248
MPLELAGMLLGLGSVVRLESQSVSGLFVVLARGAFRPDSNRDEVLARYLVGPHPYGEAPDQETFPVLASDVREVVFEGYLDDADATFLEDLLDQMENGRRITAPAKQFTDALTVVPEAGAAHPADDDSAPALADPFAELRTLASHEYRRSEQ